MTFSSTQAPVSAIPTSTADGEILAWAVAQCEGIKTFPYQLKNGWHRFEPHLNEAQAEAVIKRAEIALNIDPSAEAGLRHVAVRQGHNGTTVARGPTAMIAAMRCRVASELGDVILVRA